MRVVAAIGGAGPEIAAPVAVDGVDDPRHRHAATMRERLLFLAAHEQGEVDRLGDEQHHRDGKNQLPDQAAGPQAQLHVVGPIRFTSHASV